MTSILLDTHTWIWLCKGIELSSSTVELIDDVSTENQIWLAAISIWELSMLVAKNRVTVTKPLGIWVKEALTQPGINLYPLSPDVAVESSLLPGNFHGDPVDRMIVATASVGNFTLLTRE